MLKCYNYTARGSVCVLSSQCVFVRIFVCKSSDGPHRPVESSSSCCHGNRRTIVGLWICYLWRRGYSQNTGHTHTHTNTGWHTAHECITTHTHSTEHKVTHRPMFCHRLHLNRNTRQISRTSQSRVFEADRRIGDWTTIS